MKFFIDTANLGQISEGNDLGVLDGVTTNPSLMAKEGITGDDKILKHYIDICNIVDGDVSAEVISTNFKGMVEEGEKLASLHPQIVVKIPMIKDGIMYVVGQWREIIAIELATGRELWRRRSQTAAETSEPLSWKTAIRAAAGRFALQL